MSPRELVASSINESLHRLPLVLEILDELHDSKGPRQAGDEDLKNGSIHAVHTMMERIRRIEPVTVRNQTGTLSRAEQIANEWLLGECPHLLPPQVLEELSSLITQLLPGLPVGSNDQSGHRSRPTKSP